MLNYYLANGKPMFESFSSLSLFLQVCWGMAIVSSILFALKFALSLMGIGGASDAMDALDAADAADAVDALDAADAADALDAADAADGACTALEATGATELSLAKKGVLSDLKLISVQNILAFLCFGSWTTIVAYSNIGSVIISSILGLGGGIMMMFILAFIMRGMMKLEESGNVNLKEAVGMLGDVYLTIPARDKGRGKVNLELGGKLEEYDAICMDDEPIKSGTRVRVVDITDDDVVVVQREAEELA